jgi:hypothetical protein
MKNLLESTAILFVGLLSLAIVYFIVQYNMIEDDSIEENIVFEVPQKKITEKAKTSDYLNSLEGYGDDTDVKVDARKEDTTNTVVVKSELNKDEIGTVIDDKSKATYMKNLENYAETSEKEKLDESKPVADHSGDPEKLPEEEVVDEIGMAIDAALDDI